jgi:hypothetical protein
MRYLTKKLEWECGIRALKGERRKSRMLNILVNNEQQKTQEIMN